MFFKFLNDDIQIKDFEKWIYTSSDKLESELDSDFHLELISFDYNQKYNTEHLRDKLKKLINTDEYDLWRTKKLLFEIIENKIDLVLATRKLRTLFYDTGEKFIPITLGIGYESILDNLPIPSEYNLWESNALKEVLKKVDCYKENIIHDAQEFLDTLNRTK